MRSVGLLWRTLVAGVSFASIFVFPGALAVAQMRAPEAAAGCETCHGASGDSQKADIPRLNGQQSEYLLARLREFLDPTRGTPHATQMMWENATKISDDDAAALARYFGSHPPTQPNGSGPQVAAGAKIFQQGAGPDIPACASCHGQKGEGLGGTPRIAGQHGDYLIGQLQAFMLTARIGTPMNHHTWHMTPEQMQALSAYLSNN
jgi:cytochrome c553